MSVETHQGNHTIQDNLVQSPHKKRRAYIKTINLIILTIFLLHFNPELYNWLQDCSATDYWNSLTWPNIHNFLLYFSRKKFPPYQRRKYRTIYMQHQSPAYDKPNRRGKISLETQGYSGTECCHRAQSWKSPGQQIVQKYTSLWPRRLTVTFVYEGHGLTQVTPSVICDLLHLTHGLVTFHQTLDFCLPKQDSCICANILFVFFFFFFFFI